MNGTPYWHSICDQIASWQSWGACNEITQRYRAPTFHDVPLQWRHNDRHGVWNHQQFDGLLNYLFKLPSKKHQSPRYQPSVRGIHRWPVDFSHEGPANMGSVSLAWRHNGIGSASGSRDFTRFGPGGSTLSRFPCKTPIGKVGTSQYTVVTRKLA